MSSTSIRVYGRLNDFVPPRRRQQHFDFPFTGRPSIKDLIESAGVPHPEIDLILVNEQPVNFSALVRHGDRISVYPPFRSIDLSRVTRVGVPRPDDRRFVLDTHLGRLARYLRMLGFDTVYRNDSDDQTLEKISAHEERILMTQDVGLLKRSAITRGYYVRESDPRRQLVEVAAEFDLLEFMAPFQRCLRCNGVLVAVTKSEVEDRLLPRTRAHFDEFYRCQVCATIYWKGSHYDHMCRIVQDLERALGQPAGGEPPAEPRT